MFISPSSPKLIFDIEHAGNMADAELKGWSKLEWSNQVFATNLHNKTQTNKDIEKGKKMHDFKLKSKSKF